MVLEVYRILTNHLLKNPTAREKVYAEQGEKVIDPILAIRDIDYFEHLMVSYILK